MVYYNIKDKIRGIFFFLGLIYFIDKFVVFLLNYRFLNLMLLNKIYFLILKDYKRGDSL